MRLLQRNDPESVRWILCYVQHVVLIAVVAGADDLRFLTNRVTWAKAAVAKGEVIDLASLQPQVEDICRRIDALPEAERAPFKNGLLALIEEIEQLGLALGAGLEALRVQIGETASRRRALRAYGQQSK